MNERPISRVIDSLVAVADGIALEMEGRADLTDEDRVKLQRLANALEEFSAAAAALTAPKGKPS